MRFDDLARGARLMGHERAAQHLLGLGLRLFDGFRKTDAALVAGTGFLEMPLAATAGMDLRLHDPERSVQLARCRLGLLGLQDGASVADRRSVVAQESLRLVFMDIHAAIPS